MSQPPKPGIAKISTAEVATRVAQQRQRERSDAQGAYNRLMILAELTPEQEKELADAIETLGVQADKINSDIAALKEAMRLHEIVRVGESEAIERARASSAQNLVAFQRETDQIILQRQAMWEKLNQEQTEIESKYFGAGRARHLLAHLENQNPLLRGLWTR